MTKQLTHCLDCGSRDCTCPPTDFKIQNQDYEESALRIELSEKQLEQLADMITNKLKGMR